jgi:ribosomal 30S subunit maturation factor RimM
MVNTGKVTNVVNEGNKTIIDIAFMDKTKKTVVLPYEDINKYKDKYVICGMDSDNNTKILEIVGDEMD